MFADIYVARALIRTLMGSTKVKTYTFVVMPDHVHWLVQLRDNETLSSVVQSAKSISARRVNKKLGTKGAVWQDGFHDYAIRREDDIQSIARYVVANPVRAGIVKSVRDYPHWDAVWI